MKAKLLVVDDETSMARGMQEALRRGGYDVDRARDAAEALVALARRTYDLVVSDMRMPGMDGAELLDRIRALYPDVGVILVTAFATVESAVRCVRAGAVDYLTKPFSPDDLLRAVEQALGRGARAERDGDAGVVAVDPATVGAFELARRVASSNATVLLEAESGAGKEVFARLIHRESPRADAPFVAVNCAALPRDLLEAELFGHCRGAFTGAHRDRVGLFQRADGGTLLLDEIGEMGADLQARLLRVIQDSMIRPVGGDTAFRVDVRVIAATNRNLRQEVERGTFREDLYYRLRVVPVRIPPLRERPGDIEPLARRFVRVYGGDERDLREDALRKLQDHSWPGNVRELENAIHRATILAGPGRPLRPEHFDLEPACARDRSATDAPLSLEEAEREAVRHTLIKTRGNRKNAAAALGISARTLRHKLQRWRDEGRPLEIESV